MDADLLEFLPHQLRSLYERPSMVLHAESFDVILGAIAGYDAATGNLFLDGFREWAVPQLDHGYSLSWDGLLPKLIPEAVDGKAEVRSVLKIIAEFRRDFSTVDVRRRVYLELERWLSRQSWYKEDSPDWLE